MYKNGIILKNSAENKKVEQIDILCSTIQNNVDAGEYKKGDTESFFAGGYNRGHDVYLDKNKDKIYESEHESDESGSVSKERFYQNGYLIRDFVDNYFEQATAKDREVGWFPELTDQKTYHTRDGAFRMYRNNSGIVEIIDL